MTIYFWLLKPGRGLPDVHDQQFVAELVDAYDTGTTEPLSPNERMALPLAIARQPAWSVGRWVPYLDEENFRRHAREAMSEFAVAAKVLSEVESWQTDLSHAQPAVRARSIVRLRDSSAQDDAWPRLLR